MSREEAQRTLDAVGGTVAFNGTLLQGESAIDILMKMPKEDLESLSDDMALLNEQNSYGFW